MNPFDEWVLWIDDPFFTISAKNSKSRILILKPGFGFPNKNKLLISRLIFFFTCVLKKIVVHFQACSYINFTVSQLIFRSIKTSREKLIKSLGVFLLIRLPR